MSDWWEMTDFGFIHAARGTGKSFFALALCHALTTGQEIAGWKIEKPVKVMYIDGEMSQQDLQNRCRGLDLGNENFRSINHDAFFRENGSVFCLSEEKDQNALLQHCYNQGVKVLVLDNLSSLFRGVEENSADDWEKILGWLLKCRRYGISVVLIHHSAKTAINVVRAGAKTTPLGQLSWIPSTKQTWGKAKERSSTSSSLKRGIRRNIRSPLSGLSRVKMKRAERKST
jgi:RecA-family ATPase